VVDEEGAALAEAEVCLGEAFCTETRKDGRFTLPPCAAQSAYDLSVSAEGYLLNEVTLSEAEIRRHPIVLSRGGTVGGLVIDAQSGYPLSKAAVRIQALEQVHSHSHSLETETSGEGTFRFFALEPSTYRVKAWLKGYMPAEETLSLEGPPLASEVTLALQKGKGLRGRVLTEAGGEGVPGAFVSLRRTLTFRDFPAKSGAVSYEAESDAEGRYLFCGVDPGRYRLEASGPSGSTAIPDLLVTADQDSLPDLMLTNWARLSGTVVAPRLSTEELSGYRISLLTQAYDLHPRTTVTDGEGNFSFEELPPGSYRLACYRSLSAVPALTVGVELGAGKERQVALPLHGVRATFQVEVAGHPASGGKLSLAPRTGAAFDTGIVSLQTPLGRVLLGLPSAIATGDADENGMVTLEGLSPEPSMASLFWRGMRFTLPISVPDPPPTVFPLRFVGSVLEGRVLSAGGQPAEGVSVSFSYEGIGVQPGSGTTTDGAGRFRFEGLGGGLVTVRASGRSAETVAETKVNFAEDQPQAAEVTLRLPPVP
jgi:hypothetical protein